jgi:hypothetical protein
VTANGQWSWWRDGNRTVVGWMRAEPFGQDFPICTVRDSRDAGLVVDLLTHLEAEPVIGTFAKWDGHDHSRAGSRSRHRVAVEAAAPEAEGRQALMFDKGEHKYRTDIELGKRYKDPQTGIEGTATAVTFFQYACERVSIETVVAGKIEEYGFDAPRLESVETQKRARAERTGGPGDPVPRAKGAKR